MSKKNRRRNQSRPEMQVTQETDVKMVSDRLVEPDGAAIAREPNVTPSSPPHGASGDSAPDAGEGDSQPENTPFTEAGEPTESAVTTSPDASGESAPDDGERYRFRIPPNSGKLMEFAAGRFRSSTLGCGPTLNVAIIGRVDRAATGNPGDALIMSGCESLLQATFRGSPIQFHRLSKFASEREMTEWLPLLQEVDLIVVAGTPCWNRLSDWCFPYDRFMYTEVLSKVKAPLWILGGGAGGSAASPEEFAARLGGCPETCLVTEQKLRRCSLITSRDAFAHEWLMSDRLKGARGDVELDICPSVYAPMPVHLKPGATSPTGAIVLCPFNPHVKGTEWRDRWGALAKLAEADGREVIWVAHTSEDWSRTNRCGWECHMASDWRGLAEVYSRGACIITSRLHGAACGWAQGIPTALVKVDVRAATAEQMRGIVVAEKAFDPKALYEQVTALPTGETGPRQTIQRSVAILDRHVDEIQQR